MKRFFTLSFIIIALLVGTAGAAPAVHATVCAPGYITDVNGNAEQASDRTPCTPDASSGDAVNAVADEYGVATPPVDPVAAKQGTDNKPTVDDAYSGIMQKIMSLFAWLVGVAALTLDYAVYYTVVTMGDYVNNLSAVGVTWQIMRDIGNIVIIFGFLAIGICTILDVKWYGGGTSMLPKLLLAAVFLNFSLFMTEAIIDTGNLFATQFYTQIKGGTLPTAASLSGTGIIDAVERDGISNKIMGQLGLQTIYTAGRVNTEVFKAGNSFLIGFMGIILFLITAFVLFSLAFVLIARFVILLLLIIVAPIGFAGLAIPNLAGTAKMWWDKLIQQTITAPVLLLLLYIALRIITDTKFLTGLGIAEGSRDSSGFWTGFVANNNLAGFGGMMISFLVAMGLLLAVVIFSKKLSAFGAAGASQLAGKLSFGATAAGMRFTAGAGLNAMARGFRNTKLARVPVIGRTFAGVLDRGAKASFDVRGIKAGGGLGALGVDAGKAKEGGYRKQEEEAIKAREAHAKSLGQTSEEKTMQKTEEGRKRMMEETVNVIEGQGKTEMDNLINSHAVDLQRFNQAVDQERSALRVAQAGQNRVAIDAAQLALNTALLDQQREREKQNKEREELKKVHDRLIKVQKDKVDARQKEVDKLKRAPQESYAKNLEEMPWGALYKNSKAAENIRKTAGKSKEEKDVDTLMDLLKKNTSPTTGAPPPAPSPAGNP